MKRPTHRNKTSPSSQRSKNNVIEQVFVTPITQPRNVQRSNTPVLAVADTPILPIKVNDVVREVIPVAIPVAMVSGDDRALREFLSAADLHAQQIFLAQVAVLSVRDAQHQWSSMQDQRLKLLQHNLEAVLQQHQQLETSHEQLKTQYQALQHSSEQVKAQSEKAIQLPKPIATRPLQIVKTANPKQPSNTTPTSAVNSIYDARHHFLALQADADRHLSRLQEKQKRRKRKYD